MGWVSPTEHTEGSWTDEANAHDNDTGTAASYYGPPGTWSPNLELTLTEREPSSIQCDKVRFYVACSYPPGFEVDIDVYYDSAWHDVFEGVSNINQWIEKDIPNGTQDISKARIRTKHGSGMHTDYVKEFDFWGIEPAISPLVNGGLVR